MKIKPIYIVGIFILTLFYLFSREAKADVYIEAGATMLSGDWAGQSLVLSERFGRWDFALGYVTEQQFSATCGPKEPSRPKCEFDIRENTFIHAQRIVQYKKWEMGIGPAYFQHTSRVSGSNFMFSLMLGYNITEHTFVRIRHSSSAGAATPNLGQDMLTIGGKF